jgi:hypothetical protein
MPQFSDDIYVGKAAKGANPRRGVKLTPIRYYDLGAVAAALGEGIIKDATGTEIPDAAETVTYTASTDGTGPQDASTRPDKVTVNVSGVVYDVLDLGGYGRNIVSVVTHASSIVAMTIKHYGFDYRMQPMTETGSITATGTSKTFAGKKAFRYWWKTELTAAADASTNTVDVGTGAVFGVPYKVTTTNAVIALRDGAVDTGTKVAADVTDPATSSTGDVRGTVDFTTDPNGTATYALWVAVPDATTVGAYGVTQA